MNRRLVLAAVVTLTVCLALSVAGILIVNAALTPFTAAHGGAPLPSIQAAAPSSSTALALPAETPLPDIPNATADALRTTQIPERNLYEIVPRLRKTGPHLTPVPTPVARVRQLGEQDTFFVVENASTGKYRQVTATLQATVPHAYYWVENGIDVDKAALSKAADFFETSIYPTNHKYFGQEMSPGPDGDVHIHVLITRFQDAAGYFSSEDTFPQWLVQYSNSRNIIYLNFDAVKPGTDDFSADTAHEFQHMIHSYESIHKTGWIDEGMGDLAIKVNGFDVGGVLRLFARNPDTQLNTWANEPQASLAHYAASYLFFDYTAGRFGPEFTQKVIHAPAEGINGIQAILDQMTPKMSFQDLFSDWAVANLLNSNGTGDSKYSYTNEPSFRITNEPSLSQYPVTRNGQMREYASNYYQLTPSGGDVTVTFEGATTNKLLPADAHSGRWVWYSNRADLANMRLTRPVDLSKVSQATLQFWTWYDIEKNFDYAYVEASTDGGTTWDILPGKSSTTENPNGASYGPAFTGRSGATSDNAPAQWIQEQVDLSAYAGKKILLRFEYITDDAFNAPSWAIDDVAIPEIGFADNVEGGANGWQAEGFVRSDNVLPQQFVVQVVTTGKSTRVERIQLDSQNRGSMTITGLGKDVTRADLVITAFAPTTTEMTSYQLTVTTQ